MKKMLSLMITALFVLSAWPLLADDEREVEPAEELHPFFRDMKFNANLYYFQRYRDRYDLESDRYGVNLDHATAQLSLDLQSGWLNDLIGFDFGIFGAYDFRNKSASADHEMNFVPWRDPWHAKWDRIKNKDAASVYKALVKVKSGPVWARAGYFQPQGPGVLGVNWSFLPGTYQGAEAGFDLGRWSLAAAWANQYKAPWYTTTYHFQQQDADGELHEVGHLWSLGARYQATDNLSLEVAYGESKNYLWNAHFKLKYNLPLNGGDSLYLTWQTYFMNDQSAALDDNFSAMAQHHYLGAVYSTGPWVINAEGTFTRAPNSEPGQAGYFAYRLTRPSGGSKGAYEPWWDLRSDWNHHNEKAMFLKVGRSLDDMGLTGVKAAVSGAYGWDGRSSQTSQKFSEAALGLDLSYTFSGGGLMDGSVLALHFTYYDNLTNLPNWNPYHNAFQDEHDIKLSLVIPLTK
ncbi:hypothetical protein C4J81_11070 [Deltaproteobacteria bacterium Smac51]|nr:hypothetical protein C4J81_11070 [Deltaproteobacteria bacterium Smac51]